MNSAGDHAAAARPNVVLIFMDDMTHWALRSSQCITPNLDRLRARGTTFTHAFNQGSMNEAVCMPARQMLISGLTLFDAQDHFMDVPHIGAQLGQHGYRTYFTGKWHNEEQALENDYDHVGPWAGGMLPSTEIGGDAYYRPSEKSNWDPTDTRRGGHWMQLDDGTVQHSSERWTDAAVGFIRGHVQEEPFFLHLAYHAPHDPRQMPQEFLDLYVESDVAIPPNFMPEHPFDNGELEVRDEILAPLPRTQGAIQLHRHEYFAILTHVDREIGRILDALDDIGQTANTLIVFSGDHGLALGEHGLMGKQNPYDHSIRVPLVFAGPGVPAGKVVDDLVYSGSTYPTICELLGLPVPAHIGFDSLRPALVDTGSKPRSAVFVAYKSIQRLIRTPSHKLIEYPQSDIVQLFNLDTDPWEMRDLSGDSAEASRMDAMRELLRAEQRSLGDPLAVSETSALS